MSQRPLISIIITCYNYESYVREAIASALQQTYTEREVIVVNDGSTDGSLEAIHTFGSDVILIDQANQGSVAACNAGFARSRGQLVLLLDADDRLEPTALERVAERWRPGCVKVQYDLGILDSEGNDLGRRFCCFTPDYDAERVRRSFAHTGTYRWPVSTGNVYERGFLEQYFPLPVDHGPDGYLNTLAPLHGRIETIAEALGHYRIHGANRWSNAGVDTRRLAERIEFRYGEIQSMRQAALERGLPTTQENPLDYEIAFLNYRMMATKLGIAYRGSRTDTPGSLLRKARRVIQRERYPAAIAKAHHLWFATLAVAPRPVALSLMRLRYARGQIRQAALEAVGAPLRKLRGRRFTGSQPYAEEAATP